MWLLTRPNLRSRVSAAWMVGWLRMGVFVGWRRLIKSAGLISSCLIVLLASSSVHAGCGGNVHLSRQTGDDPLLEHPFSSQSTLISDSHGALPVPVRHKPCSGPGCSRKPFVPPMQAPTSPAPDRYEEWGCLPLSLLQPCEELAALLPTEDQLLPFDQAVPIFHPPRSI